MRGVLDIVNVQDLVADAVTDALELGFMWGVSIGPAVGTEDQLAVAVPVDRANDGGGSLEKVEGVLGLELRVGVFAHVGVRALEVGRAAFSPVGVVVAFYIFIFFEFQDQNDKRRLARTVDVDTKAVARVGVAVLAPEAIAVPGVDVAIGVGLEGKTQKKKKILA